MANVGFQVAGFSAASFSTGTSTCGATLNNGSSCTVQVIFTPAVAGGASATLAVSSSTLGVKAAQAALSGIGHTANGLNVNPPQLTLTQATIGQPSVAQTVSLSNSGALPANGLALTVPAPFSLSQSTCGMTLARSNMHRRGRIHANFEWRYCRSSYRRILHAELGGGDSERNWRRRRRNPDPAGVAELLNHWRRNGEQSADDDAHQYGSR
jgi:hypothetical protein